MRQLWLLVAFAGSGCNSLLGIDELTPIDASGDEIDAAAIDSPGGSICAMLVAPAPCFAPLPTEPILVEAVNTDTDPRCVVSVQTGGASICAILGGTITIPAGGAIISGTRPLMLVAATTLRVDGILDASSAEGTTRIGPGATPNPAGCGTLDGGGGTDGGGGGAGGSFSTKGGDGGDGGGNQAGNNGANAANGQVPTFLRAGCRGGAGGRTGNGPGGYGGGAIYLVAGTSIAIANRVTANGAGGTGASNGEAAGGGGGAGGMIVLEAPAISLVGAAEISANGGGGGEGTVDSNAGEGGESPAWNTAAVGGFGGSTDGGNGGTGATGTATAAPGVGGVAGGDGNDGGGGGGGGGAGVIWIRGPAPTGAQMNQISPAPISK